ncbi:MAG TPA: hypothetical protein DDY13_19940 [Cytophagales bacterium]|jgi:hypothetical protein|nr:hypothetical protein [Cytophagales bacterium]
MADDHNHIPKIFHSYDTGQPFDHCKVCGRNLLDGQTRYFIEKAVNQYKGLKKSDVVFEYAICMPCYEEINQTMSEESKKNIQEYFTHHVNLLARNQFLMGGVRPDIDHCLSHCVITHTPRNDTEQYQIVGLFQGNQIVYETMPMMISMEAIDEMANLLSNKTLDGLNDFMDDILDLPPELKGLFKDKPVLI